MNATGSLINNMFVLDVINSESPCVESSDISTCKLRHRRLEHASVPKLNLLLGTKFELKDLQCVTCTEGKQTRKPFIADGNKTEHLLELMHSDVCGPIKPQSIGGIL